VPGRTPSAVLCEGARLIIGDVSRPIEHGARCAVLVAPRDVKKAAHVLSEIPAGNLHLHLGGGECALLHSDRHHGDVVAKLTSDRKGGHGAANGLNEGPGAECGVADHAFLQPFFAKQFSRGVPRFGDPVREEEQFVADFERDGDLLVDLLDFDSQRQIVPKVTKLSSSISRSASSA